jgi:hypothetical protein
MASSRPRAALAPAMRQVQPLRGEGQGLLNATVLRSLGLGLMHGQGKGKKGRQQEPASMGDPGAHALPGD